MQEHVVIIGNGISGITAARHIRKNSNRAITVISKESKYFFSRTALMYVYMGHMRFRDTQPYENHFWEKNRIDLVHDEVLSIDYDKKCLRLKSGRDISYNKLVLATGSSPNKFPWPGVDAIGVQGLYSKQDLEELEAKSSSMKKAVIVGGGLIGIELAEMLLSRNIEVHFLVREEKFWSGVLPDEDAQLVMKHISKHHGLTMHYGTELEEIRTNSSNEVVGIRTKDGLESDCDFVGLTVGVHPQVSFLKDSQLEIDKGILINEYLETNISDVYAIGDCAQHRQAPEGRRPIEQVWYTGRMMGETLAKTICGVKTKYLPGPWFNSAKFFDLEYQTYGQILPQIKENEERFVWQHPNEDLLLHFAFDKNSKTFLGVNTYGIRLRHEVCDHWLRKNSSIHEVLENFSSANFDPEFYKTFEAEIVQEFNQKYNATLQLSKAKWWLKILQAQ